MSKVILLEMNELCPSLLEKFMADGALPNFTRLFQSSTTYTTDANCDTEYLEPWIQWVTLHTGLPFEKHNVYRLGQAQTLNADNIWDVLSQNGKTSWLCGSMNAKWNADDPNITALPDPWSVGQEASPKELADFYHFVRVNVQEHTNVNHTLSLGDNLRFLKFMLNHGLSKSTIKRILDAVYKQVSKADDRWKKATLLDWLQYDVFEAIWKKKQPDFATFFTNSTAHFQHKFWRYMEPEHFSLKPSDEDVEKYRDAILFAYQNHDEIIGRALKLAGNDTSIIFATALSQQPYTLKDEEGGKRFYRPHKMEDLERQFELSGIEKISPVMSHQFHVICQSEAHANENFEKLRAATWGDSKPLFSVRLEGSDVFGGCCIYQPIDESTVIQRKDGSSIPFSDVFYLADNLKSGMHHPHGAFWVYRAGQRHEKPDGLLPLEETFHLILDECGVTTEASRERNTAA